MSVRGKIKEAIVSHAVEKSLLLGAFLIGLAWVALKPVISERVLPPLSKELLAGSLAAAVALLIASGAYILYLRKRLSPKLEYRFGVLWDRAQNPYCPRDKTWLQVKKANNPYERFPNQFACANCDRSFELSDEEGFAIFTLADARQKLASH
jgi:hypothetical protein